MIAKLLENCGREYSSKTARKLAKDKQADYSEFLLNSSRDYLAK
jgi:hypothetical protein